MADGYFAGLPDDAGIFVCAGDGGGARDGSGGEHGAASGGEEKGGVVLAEREVELKKQKLKTEKLRD